MRLTGFKAAVFAPLVFLTVAVGVFEPAISAQAQARQDDPLQILVDRLNLEKYKATTKALTQFGDRLQGTDRNKAAIDWIEAQLKSYGCAPERLRYVYKPAPPATPPPPAAPASPRIGSGEVRTGPGGSRLRGMTGSHSGGPGGTDWALSRTRDCGR